MNSSSSDALDSQSPETVGQINPNHGQNCETERDGSKMELSEERINFFRVINTFKSYGQVSKEKLMKKMKYFESLPVAHQVILLNLIDQIDFFDVYHSLCLHSPSAQKYLTEYKDSLEFQLKCVGLNDEVIRRIAADIDIFENDALDQHEQELYESEAIDLRPEDHFHDKIHSILKQIGG